jgi:hypothetical protein
MIFTPRFQKLFDVLVRRTVFNAPPPPSYDGTIDSHVFISLFFFIFFFKKTNLIRKQATERKGWFKIKYMRLCNDRLLEYIINKVL